MTEAFSFLNPISSLSGFHPSWIPRLPDINVSGDREFALHNLGPAHDAIIAREFPEIATRHHAEQIHGSQISIVSKTSPQKIITHPASDGLITNLPRQLLSIYIADCAAIYLADPVTRSIGLLHAGKKGTSRNILKVAVESMILAFGTRPADLICVISPCIRPPHYEIDFAATIVRQASDLGIKSICDSLENTASDPDCHYSYRLEKGRTGRMLALLSITT
ncbi:MAG: polyphenol oxidase family protein [Armatimonadetes bacterium]|nr:polyphenol oxidase family protein [Akkermansiaceae bacterium]